MKKSRGCLSFENKLTKAVNKSKDQNQYEHLVELPSSARVSQEIIHASDRRL